VDLNYAAKVEYQFKAALISNYSNSTFYISAGHNSFGMNFHYIAVKRCNQVT
jgi:hypothetical protein